jgi:MFS family permease
MLETPERVVRRLLTAAFFTDAGFFLAMAAVPYKVLHLGGGPLALGVVPAISSLTYIFMAQMTGRWSDRIGRYRMTRYGNLAFVVFCSLAQQAPSLPWLMLVMPLAGAGTSLFWPAIQAAVGDLAQSRGALTTNIGRFNVAWSLGKVLGYFGSGLLLARASFYGAFLTAVALTALSFLSLPREDSLPASMRDSHRAGDDESGAEADSDRAKSAALTGEAAGEVGMGTGMSAGVGAGEPTGAEAFTSEGGRSVFRRMGWLSIFAAYGMAGVLGYQLPKWFQTLGWPETRFGFFLAAVFGVQTLVFALLAGRLRFTYSARRLLAPQLAAAAAMIALPFLPVYAGVLALALPLGASFGVAYAASIFYSLHVDTGRGRNAGIHESLVGAGHFAMPLLGGLAAAGSGSLMAPYFLAGGATVLAVGVQALWWRHR